MTDTDELEHILTGLINYTAKIRNCPALYPDAGLLDIHAAKAAILAWHTKQLKQAEHAAEVRGRIEALRAVRDSNVHLNHGTIELIGYMLQDLNKQKNRLEAGMGEVEQYIP